MHQCINPWCLSPILFWLSVVSWCVEVRRSYGRKFLFRLTSFGGKCFKNSGSCAEATSARERFQEDSAYAQSIKIS